MDDATVLRIDNARTSQACSEFFLIDLRRWLSVSVVDCMIFFIWLAFVEDLFFGDQLKTVCCLL